MSENCWEFMQCGREPGGNRVHEMGVCPAAISKEADGFLGGRNGGRGCCYITGTFCSGTIQNTKKDKEKHCESCSFYAKLREEHGAECTSIKFGRYVRSNRSPA